MARRTSPPSGITIIEAQRSLGCCAILQDYAVRRGQQHPSPRPMSSASQSHPKYYHGALCGSSGEPPASWTDGRLRPPSRGSSSTAVRVQAISATLIVSRSRSSSTNTNRSALPRSKTSRVHQHSRRRRRRRRSQHLQHRSVAAPMRTNLRRGAQGAAAVGGGGGGRERSRVCVWPEMTYSASRTAIGS